MPFDRPTLSTASAEDIQAALEVPGTPIRCQYCGEVFTPRNKWQTFCSAKHRAAYHREAETREIERLQGTIAALNRQIAELQKELADSIDRGDNDLLSAPLMP
ncbi:MAG TPA: hypothetical protein PLB31_11830 [Fimbriimonadaceae bacterium]|nr:hypothetical protein [Fimbriimonadaceae bacterium]